MIAEGGKGRQAGREAWLIISDLLGSSEEPEIGPCILNDRG